MGFIDVFSKNNTEKQPDLLSFLLFPDSENCDNACC